MDLVSDDPNYFDVEEFADNYEDELAQEESEPTLSELDLHRTDYVDWSDVDAFSVFEE